ncbi:MAG TPA: glycoside hydrolase family 2 TIM barrel-domain containing protein, partial [Abditibacteriaceae bacterium]
MKSIQILVVPVLVAATCFASTASKSFAQPMVAADAPWPTSAKVLWGTEPVQEQSPRRARVNLNGVWKFSPAQTGAQSNQAPQQGWGYMEVPGNWRRQIGVTSKGTGPQWTGFDGKKLAGAWYERTLKVPADWAGRHISLDFQRISTDATIWINDKPAGKINWPEGEIDITNFVTAGQEATVRTFVVATTDQKEVLVMMGDAPGQNWTTKAELLSAGLVGNVTLQSRPLGAHVSDVYIKPSTRKKQLGLDVELTGVKQGGPVEIVARLLDEQGREEKRFTQTINATAQPTQRVQFAWDWDNPRLWDYKKPNLYTLSLSTKGAGIDDEPAERFGFREVWIQGRDIFFNGTPFRVRPTLMGSGAMGAGSGSIQAALELGYNFGEIWPEDIETRSRDARYTDWYDTADKEGFPISGIMPHMGWMGGNFNTADKQAAFRADAERLMRRYRNHPSIIMWGTSGNMFGASRDPRYVGMKEEATRSILQRGHEGARHVPLAEKGVDLIKTIDPTRPVFIHNGGSAGDLYTLNHYLNFIPLQEREEWLSNYVQKGDMPLMYVEFGTPVNISIMRGRSGFVNAYKSENWLTEFASVYLGNEAYQTEPADYRKRSAELFEKDQTHGWSHSMKERDYSPSWMKIQDL